MGLLAREPNLGLVNGIMECACWVAYVLHTNNNDTACWYSAFSNLRVSSEGIGQASSSNWTLFNGIGSSLQMASANWSLAENLNTSWTSSRWALEVGEEEEEEESTTPLGAGAGGGGPAVPSVGVGMTCSALLWCHASCTIIAPFTTYTRNHVQTRTIHNKWLFAFSLLPIYVFKFVPNFFRKSAIAFCM